ncbi:MAG: dynamin family protein [Rhodomicrobium sp.]
MSEKHMSLSTQEPARPMPVSLQDIGVSTKLCKIRNDVIGYGNALEKEIDGRVNELVSDLLRELESCACRVAFVGQVKAGKSSLINALIQRPNFLPADVNPSTAVVTKLFLGSRFQKQGTALFHFFTEAEWDNLVAEQPPLRERPQALSLPNTRAHLNALQRRAEQRAGGRIDGLLGKHHLFSSVTTELLQQYVSAPENTPASSNPRAFSDLTSSAEIFLEAKPSAFPSVLIDTPGVNDLFFLRDEVTYANLADADIYLLVLSALNPLSESDLSLLRLIRGLQKDRIIAVINRIDCVAADHIPALVTWVQHALSRECPQATIPIVLASAHWGQMALGNPSGAIPLPAPDSLAGYAGSLGLESPGEASTVKARSYESGRQMLLDCSGIPRIIEMINSLMAKAVTEEQLLPAASTFAAVAHNAAASSRFALETLSTKSLFSQLIQSWAAAEIKAGADRTLRQIEPLIASIDRFLNEAFVVMEDTIDKELRNLEKYINQSIDEFAEVQSKAYFDSPSQSFDESFFKQTASFRSELADGLLRYHREIMKLLSERLRQSESELRLMMKAMLPALDQLIQFGTMARHQRLPAAVSIGKATSLESAEFWNWFEGCDAEKSQSKLQSLIASEFLLILREILASARDDLKVSASDSIRRVRLLALSALFPITGQMKSLIAICEAGAEKNAGAALKEFGTKTREKIARFEALSTNLKAVKKRCFDLH